MNENFKTNKLLIYAKKIFNWLQIEVGVFFYKIVYLENFQFIFDNKNYSGIFATLKN